MSIKIKQPAVAELFTAARQLLFNTPYNVTLAPSLDRVRNALAAFAEPAIAVPAPAPAAPDNPAVTDAPAPAAPPLTAQPGLYSIPAGKDGLPGPAPKKADRSAAVRLGKAAAKKAAAKKPAAKKPVKVAKKATRKTDSDS